MESGPSASLWNDILADASTSRSAPQKTLFILGDPRSGKETVSASLRGAETKDSPWTGLGYQYFNVKDPQDQETLARCSVYSCSKPSQDFLQLPLQPSHLTSALALLCLDFSRPESFIDSLLTWLSALHALTQTWSGQQQSTTHAYDLQNAQDRLRHLWSTYQEPTSKPDGTLAQPLPVSSSSNTSTTGHQHAAATQEDLPKGTLPDNLGLQFVIVCTKTDLLDQLEKDRRYSEETFDFIQQVLRTICLRYGAALFFVSTHRPNTLSTLKDYVLHQLFNSFDDAASSASSALRTFPFLHRANVVDRDALLVPAGWDSWGKIKVLRDSFDAHSTSLAWSHLISQSLGQDDGDGDEDGGASAASTLLGQWGSVVGETSDQSPSHKNTSVRVTDEQDFLRTHFDLLAKDKDKQAASQAARPTASVARSPSELAVAGPGVVGPMASSALHLPSVERALGMSTSSDATHIQNPTAQNAQLHARKDSARLGEATEKFARLSSRKDSNGAQSNPRSPLLSPPANPASPPATNGAGPPGTQNEVLANFFQSLLSARKDPTNARSSAGGRGSPSLPQQQHNQSRSHSHSQQQQSSDEQ